MNIYPSLEELAASLRQHSDDTKKSYKQMVGGASQALGKAEREFGGISQLDPWTNPLVLGATALDLRLLRHQLFEVGAQILVDECSFLEQLSEGKVIVERATKLLDQLPPASKVPFKARKQNEAERQKGSRLLESKIRVLNDLVEARGVKRLIDIAGYNQRVLDYRKQSREFVELTGKFDWCKDFPSPQPVEYLTVEEVQSRATAKFGEWKKLRESVLSAKTNLQQGAIARHRTGFAQHEEERRAQDAEVDLRRFEQSQL